MGEQVQPKAASYAGRRQHRDKLRRCLDALRIMVDNDRFDVERTLTGMELELNLVGELGDPAMTNHEVLSDLFQGSHFQGTAVQDELGKFNLELNLSPRSIVGDGLVDYERELRESLRAVDASAQKSRSTVVLIGTLPTMRREHARLESLSEGSRYQVLNAEIMAARGEEIDLNISGFETLQTHTDSIAPESANTSVQYHLQVTPEQFPRYWNAAQAIAGVQLATSANSPYLFGSQLWSETRVILFEQATDTRCSELRTQGVRPRTWFGERWISSVADLFEENLSYFTPLVSDCDDEDPVDVAKAGGVPRLGELRLHNGTVYRWNRPVYDVGPSGPHLRVENRPVPAGPTPVDVCANMAFYLGLVAVLAESERPVWKQLPFEVAEQNFVAAARHGIDSHMTWPGVGQVPARALVLDVMLPMAADGLSRLGVDDDVSARLLAVIEGRCRSRVNGAVWQVDCVNRLQTQRRLTRPEALREMMRRYARHSATNTPVHEWPSL